MKYVRIISAVVSTVALIISICALYTIYQIPSRSKAVTDTVKVQNVYKIGTDKALVSGPHPGEIWRYQHKPVNPFDSTQHFILYDSVIAVKDGYVQFWDMGRKTISSEELCLFVLEAHCINCK